MLSSFFTNLLTDFQNHSHQGLWMGYLTAAGSSARVAGPVVVSVVYKNYGLYLTVSLMIGSLLISLILTIFTYKRLVPADLKRLENSSKEEETTDL
jgi:MFS family permease